ncbi:hypothetical protein CANARDRAFT_151336 [[Candida] arabinofermentans NRRL YB-2248]|uniref:RBR-type E3 ubiquitin transferase n=1 Tax=[Candida] arabinofermentans NRRL YB-2248 TaxID=983967 RepID=A0A1E4T133_9ASCO|nr:hypothetical protein CANARDRAFT_151336 [[Candida] arabinofermentans NRRL YB-2248]
MTTVDSTDAIAEELESLRAIYPESQLSLEHRTGAIEIPIILLKPITIKFAEKESQISRLPSVLFEFELPLGYPYEQAPITHLSSRTNWISRPNLERLESKLRAQWDDYHDMILFFMVDYLKTESENAFDSLDLTQPYHLNNLADYENLVDFDNLGQQEEFNLQTFTCEICQDDKKGKVTERISPCDHKFCTDCLTKYFTDNILKGEVDNIHCPAYECTKSHVANLSRLNKGITDPSEQDLATFEMDFFKRPLETKFLSRLIPDELVTRYESLYERLQYDRYRRLFPFRVSECPRRNCGRFFLREDEDQMLTVCPYCKMAFCFACLRSWHGLWGDCKARKTSIPFEDLDRWIKSEDESKIRDTLAFKYGRKAMILAHDEYIADQLFEELVGQEGSGISRCPICQLVVQRSEGCNKMTCTRCFNYFCNLCGEILQKVDPYEHYNNPLNECYRRLFEGLVPDEQLT